MLIYDFMIQGPVKVSMADSFQQFKYTWMVDCCFSLGESFFMVVLYRDEATVFCFPNLVLVGSLCGMDANFNFKDVLCDSVIVGII